MNKTWPSYVPVRTPDIVDILRDSVPTANQLIAAADEIVALRKKLTAIKEII